MHLRLLIKIDVTVPDTNANIHETDMPVMEAEAAVEEADVL